MAAHLALKTLGSAGRRNICGLATLSRLILWFALAACSTQTIWADYVVTRAYRSATNAEFERLFLSEVTRSGNSVSVGAPVMLNPTLPDARQVWGFEPVTSQNQVVYGAYEPGEAAVDDLFVVSLRQPGIARQLNPVRANPGAESVVAFAGNGDGPRIVYALHNSATSVDSLYLADSRIPGRSTLVAELPAGDEIGSNFALSPDGATFAYNIEPATGADQLAVTFLNQPANSVVVYSDSALTNYSPTEPAFSDDGTLLVWIDNGAGAEPGPLRAVTLDPVTGSVGPLVQVSGSELVDERVSEFAIKPGSNTKVAYRAYEAGGTVPSDTLLSDLVGAGTVTKLNSGPFRGAAFTTWEDVLWRGDTVLFNATEDQVLRADVFSVGEDDAGNSTILTRQVPFATERGTKASGASHFVLSPDADKTAIVDGDPALSLFVIDRFNIGASVEPFNMTAARSLISITDPSQIPPRFNPGSDMIAMVISEERSNASDHKNLYVASASSSSSEVPVLTSESPQVFSYFWFDDGAVTAMAPTAMAAAVLPASRSGQVGATLTAFVTLINGGNVVAERCSIDLVANVPAQLSYQTTNSATNALIGTANTPVDIAIGAAQSFVISISLTGEFAPTDAALAYSCRNADAVAPLSGLNTLLLSASTNPVPDVIALAATASGDGIVRLDQNGNGAFSVASVNVGAGSAISVIADTATGAAVALCESDPATAACVNPASPTFGPVSVTVAENGTPTFSVFASSSENIGADAANNRVRVIFSDATSNVRGQTSVAVQSSP